MQQPECWILHLLLKKWPVWLTVVVMEVVLNFHVVQIICLLALVVVQDQQYLVFIHQWY
jgi:hypothetical protein